MYNNRLKKFLIISLIALFIENSALAAEKRASSDIPLKDFAQKSQFSAFKISPDGKHVAFTYDKGNEVQLGIMNLESKKIVQGFEAGEDRRVVYFDWINDKRVIFRTQKITGWLDGQNPAPLLLAANIDGSDSYRLWDFQRSGLRVLSMFTENPKQILVGKYHWQDGGAVKVHRMDTFGGRVHLMSDIPKVTDTKSKIVNVFVDTKDVPRLALEHHPQDEDDFYDDTYVMHYKKDKDWNVFQFPMARQGAPTFSPLGFSKSGTKFFFASNHDLETDSVTGLFEFDMNSKKINLLFRHPDVDILDAIEGPSGEVIGAVYEPGYPTFHYLKDEEVKDSVSFHKSLQASFKGQTALITSYTEDSSMATIQVYSDRNPGDYYVFDYRTNKLTYLASSKPTIKTQEMAYVEPFIMTARDGTKMYGQMTLPQGKELKDLPMVIYPHGGPYGAADSWGWDDRAQLLASRGYLVVQLNFRGSGGYGYDFHKKGFGEWGAKMQDDLTDATMWAIKNGYADKDRICLHGVSYGGYASLQAVVKEPDLYQCSIPDAGTYDLDLQWKKADTFGSNTEARERYMKQALGENFEEEAVKRSPALNTDKIKAALFLVHGTEDVRVPIENSYVLEKALKKSGKPYKTLYREDGHGFQKIEYRVELYEQLLEFLEEHIGN